MHKTWTLLSKDDTAAVTCILCHGRGVIEIKCQPQTCLLVDEACQGRGRVRDCAEIEAQVCQIPSACQQIQWLCSVESGQMLDFSAVLDIGAQ